MWEEKEEYKLYLRHDKKHLRSQARKENEVCSSYRWLGPSIYKCSDKITLYSTLYDGKLKN